MDFYTLFLLSVLPVLILALYIYRKDKDREPFGFLVKLFFSGIGSIFITSVISIFLEIFFPGFLGDSYSSFFDLFIRVFLGVALVEEFSKWIVLYHNSYAHKEYDQVFDMIVYSAFVALGFACLENILYVFENGFRTAIVRALLAVPGHFCDGIFMGYYLSMAKLSDVNGEVSTKRKFMFLSLFVPMMMHGIYDFCLFIENGLFIILFFIFVIAMYIVTLKRIKRMSRSNRKLKYNYKFCPNCGAPVKGDICSCGSKNE